MLKTSGQETIGVFDGDAVAFRWDKKSFVADVSIPLEELLKEVSFVSVTVHDDVATEVDSLIEQIVKDDEEKVKIDKRTAKNKAALDEILATKVKATRKSNKLMDYLREKFNVSMLPFKTVIFGNKYKATKSRGSSSKKPDYEKIVNELKVKFPKMQSDIEKLEKSITKETGKSSGWSNYSEIPPED